MRASIIRHSQQTKYSSTSADYEDNNAVSHGMCDHCPLHSSLQWCFAKHHPTHAWFAPRGSTVTILHYRIQPLCRVPVTLGKGQFALGKLFAECYTRQMPLGKASHGKGIFAECRISGTRQRLCRESWHSAKQPRGTTLGRHFAECLTADTRQSFKLCRVSASGTRQSAGPGWRHVAALPSAGS